MPKRVTNMQEKITVLKLDITIPFDFDMHYSRK